MPSGHRTRIPGLSMAGVRLVAFSTGVGRMAMETEARRGEGVAGEKRNGEDSESHKSPLMEFDTT